MTVKDVRDRIERIREMAGNDNDAHNAEDTLHQDVLRAISNGECEDPAQCASIALQTEQIDFHRWCS